MSFRLETPRTLDELLDVLYSAENPVAVAGATDWIPARDPYPVETTTIVDLSGVEEMRGITLEDDSLVIGACATMAEICRSDVVAGRAAALSQAASQVGSPQIRARATIGGNAANASPAADTPVALAALGATALIASRAGKREIAVTEIPVGIGRSSLAADELIVSFRLPCRKGARSAFAKLGSRYGVSIARLNLAACISDDICRVFAGTLGPCPVESLEAASALKSADGEGFLSALSDVVDRAIPGRYSQGYKRRAIRALGEDLTRGLSL